MELNINLEIYKEDDQTQVFISEDGSSGCNYVVNSIEDVADKIKLYLQTQTETGDLF